MNRRYLSCFGDGLQFLDIRFEFAQKLVIDLTVREESDACYL